MGMGAILLAEARSYLHRKGTVAHAARHSLLALAFLRGVDYARVEARCRYAPDFALVSKEIERFGVRRDWLEETDAQYRARKQEQDGRYAAWEQAAKAHLAAKQAAPESVAGAAAIRG